MVSRRLGHAKASINLDIYGHLIPNMQTEAAELIDELVTPIKLHLIAPDLLPATKIQQEMTGNTQVDAEMKEKTA